MDWRPLNFDWNRARTFLAAAEEGSFSAAARALGTTQPTVGRQIAALEEELGVTLFERVGTRQVLTGSALELLEHVRAMAEGATRLSLSATGSAESVNGTVVVTASETISAHLLGPALVELRSTHPGIEIEIVASNERRDLRRREADIAIRNFRPEQSDLISRKIRDSEAFFYASPAYLSRIGGLRERSEIAKAEIFGFDRTTIMLDGLRALGLSVERANFPMLSSNHLVQWELCKQGAGLCMMMKDVGDAEPRVQRVLPEIVHPVPIWLACHRELRTSRRIRVVFDQLACSLA